MSSNSIPFSTRLSINGSAREMIARDQARAQKLLAAAQPGGSVDVTDAGVTYTTSVGVGSPPTQYDLLIDTGEDA